MGTVLGSFDAWESPTVNGFDAHGLVCHLAAVETWFAATLGAATFVAPENVDANDHLGMTGPLTRALRAQAPAVAVAAWLTSAEGVLAALATADLGTPAGFYEINGPLAAVVIARMFELWTHEEDLRRATGLSLNPPPAASLALMTDLGVAALPHALVGAGLADSRTIEITLTGRGAGHWVRALDGDEPGEPAAFLVCDATDLCRVIADRCDPLVLMARPTTVIEGDRDLVHRVLVGATHMAAD